MTAHLLVFTPVTPGGLQRATEQSVVSQRFIGEIRWEIGRCNPYPGRDVRNVLAQYNYGRELCLNGRYDALVTVEQDMVLPAEALATLWEDGAAVVYGTYMLRHGRPVINALRHEGNSNLGMSLSLYRGALPQAIKAGRMEVSGVGFGCTLIRRSVLAAIPFRLDGFGNAPDMPFALDCLRQGIEQIARFDVACGHIHEGNIMETGQNVDMVTVTAKEDCSLLIDGQSVTLTKGDSAEMPAEAAAEYAALGYVELAKPDSSAPKVPRK
jgi:hypothetical protein